MRKKLFTLLFAIVASVGTLFAESGTCGDNLTWDLTDGVLTISGTGDMMNYSYSSPAPWNPYKYSIASVVINDGVTSIGNHAFYFCSDLTSVTISNTVTSIGEQAFYWCRGLTSVTIPNSVTSIGNSAFSSCSSLTSVTIPNSVTKIGNNTFSYCNRLAFIEVPNSVTSIGEQAFLGVRCIVYNGIAAGAPWGAQNINGYAEGYLVYADASKATLLACSATAQGEIIIPNSVTSIGNSAFSGCSGLTSVTIPNSVTSIGNSAFSGCSGLTSVTIPSSVTSIGNYAFAELDNISVYISDIAIWCANKGENPFTGYNLYLNGTLVTDLVIPDGVTSIGDYAFSSCSSLTSVTIPNSVTSIGDDAFYGCRGLTSVTIPNSVTNIGMSAFEGCTGLTSIEIPNSVTSIGNSAFSGCSGLTSVTIPNSVTNIGPFAFNSCSGLASMTIPNSVTSIEYGAFRFCFGLTSVTIPNSVTSIGDYAFLGCRSFTSVTIPNSVISIGEYAFSGCSGLTSVTIPNSIISIGNYAFNNVLNIEYYGTATGSPWGAMYMNKVVDGYLIYSDHTKSTLLTCNTTAEGEIVIPISVTSIGSNAFYNCSNLTSVTIPNSVTNIGYCAFDYCSSLTSVHISDISAWCNIDFGGTTANPLYYAHNLYLNGELVTDLVIPNNVTSIGDYAFLGCRSFTSVTIPNSVTNIGNYAFSSCSSLTSVHINDITAWCNIDFGGYDANPLYYAHNLYLNGELVTDLVIPNNVTSIGDYAFLGCLSFTSVTIPNSVTNIGNYAFSSCSGLKYIVSSSDMPARIYSSTFSNINDNTSFYVANLEAYHEAQYWKDMNLQAICSAEKSVKSTSVVINFLQKLWDLNNNYITSCGIEEGEQQPGNTLEYIGLEPESEYKDIPIVLTSNTGETETVNVSFTTTALELTTKVSKPVSATTALLFAETNMSDAEVSCGFEWKRENAPDAMEGTKVFCPVANGQMAGRLKNLKDDVYYKYRAFYQSAAGNMYYGDWQYIFTGDATVEFDPILYTYGASVVTENEATVSGYALAGSEDFDDQGLEYWAESRVNGQMDQVPSPRRMVAGLNEHFFVPASGIKMTVTLTDLDEGTVYKYRVYGKVGDQYYYGTEQTFTTKGVYEEEIPTSIEEVPSDPQSGIKAQKILHDGQIYILRGEKVYTITGQEVR